MEVPKVDHGVERRPHVRLVGELQDRVPTREVDNVGAFLELELLQFQRLVVVLALGRHFELKGALRTCDRELASK